MGQSFLQVDDFYNQPFPELLMTLVREIGSACIKNDYRKDLYMSLRLAIGLIENFPDLIDDYIPDILEMANEVMEYANTHNDNESKTERKNNVKAQGCQVICMCFWYNSDLTMRYIIEKKLDVLVVDLTTCLPLFTSDFEKERALYAMNGLIKMDASLWPKV